MVAVLILYDPKGPAIESLAQAIARGVNSVDQCQASLSTPEQAKSGDLMAADALVLGSPNWSGITGTLKGWLNKQGDLWEEGNLGGKPGAASTTGWGRHSGLEMTLLQLIHWMLACGMIVVGLPWSESMKESGSYYGATATAGVEQLDLTQAEALSRGVAGVALKLQS